MKASDILHYVEAQIGMAPGSLPDGGFFRGSPGDLVRGILVTWMATLDALELAIQKGHNLVVCHEPPFFVEMEQGPLYRWTTPPDQRPCEREGHPNRRRRELLDRGRLTLLHIHYGLDRLCIFDDFASTIGLGTCIAGDGYEKVFRLPRPITVGELSRRAAQALKLPQVRIVGDPECQVTYAGNLWGGVGLSSNRYWMRRQVEQGAQVLVCGEVDEEAMVFAMEYRVPLILTSHAASENIGLKNFAERLRQTFSNVPVDFYEVALPVHDLDARRSSHVEVCP